METFDLDLFIPETVRWRLEGATIDGGIPVQGSPKLALTSGGGFWICEMTNIWLRSPALVKAALALEGRMDMGATTLLVPDRDKHIGPGTTSFSVVVAVADAAALRATTLNVALTTSYPLQGGERFSIDHPVSGRRYYRVIDAEPLEGGEQQITIRPPLREAVTNEALDFNNPSCPMRMVNARDCFEAVRLGRFGRFSPVFAEAL